jgi:hypothetical protein
VASLLGRVYPGSWSDIDRTDTQKVLQAVRNNVPGLLEEMLLSDAKQLRARRQISRLSEAWALRANGPILTNHIQIFGAKLGMALHFELHKRPVPITGGVLSIFFTNAQAIKGEIPANLLTMLPTPRTISQGSRHVADQFEYSWATTEDKDHTLSYSVFRQSFAIAAIAATDREYFLSKWADKFPVFAPGEICDPRSAVKEMKH